MADALHIIIPGLLGPWLQGQLPVSATAEFHALARLCSRAAVTQTAEQDFATTLCNQFALSAGESRELPLAALTYLGDGGVADDNMFYLRADPVHLRADLRRVLLFDARVLALSAEEAELLVAEFNKTFAEDGLVLEALHPTRWYLRLAQVAQIATYPPSDVIGKDINQYLPFGKASPYWRKLLTEVQMLFCEHRVNTRRQINKALSANSVWFWGGGTMPSAMALRCDFDAIYADDILCRGLARRAGVAASAVPVNVTDWRDAAAQDENALLVLMLTRFDTLDNEPERWLEHLRWLQRNWLEGLLDAVNEKALQRICLYPCDGRVFQLDRRSLKRFWPRITPLSRHLAMA